MWGFQGHFQLAVKIELESLLKTLGVTAEPEVYLIGKLLTGEPDRYPVCVEPETSEWNEVTFEDLEEIEKEMFEHHELRQLIQSHPVAQKNQDEGISRQSFLRAVQKATERIPNSENKQTFLSSPVEVAGYWVTTVLRLNEEDLFPPHSLQKDSYEINQFRSFRLSRSLVNEAIYAFLDEITTELRKDDPGSRIMAFEKGDSEIIKSAGDNLLQQIELRSLGMHFRGDLFGLLNKISYLKYEGSEVHGGILVAPRNHPNLELNLEFAPPINVNDARRIRKLVQITTDDMRLILSNDGAIGLGRVVGDYDASREDMFEVAFRKNNTWDLLHHGAILLRSSQGQPEIPKRLINEEKLRRDLPRIFQGISTLQVDKLFRIIIATTKQKHGTLLIISDQAKEESERLSNEAVTLTPLSLDETIVQHISEIDGALIVNRDSVCHSFGTILDGISDGQKGDPSRGSRYNSAIRYVESKKINGKYTCVAVIVSSDGMVDLYPNLLPQILRKELNDTIAKIEAISEQAEVERSAFSRLMSYIRENEFYLKAADCDRVNKARSIIDANLRAAETGREAYIIYRDFVASPEMDDSYYL